MQAGRSSSWAPLPQLRSCVCNKCHVCILAHHVQCSAPSDQTSRRFLTPRVQKPFNEGAQPTGLRSVPSIDPRGARDMPPATLHQVGCGARDTRSTPEGLRSEDCEGQGAGRVMPEAAAAGPPPGRPVSLQPARGCSRPAGARLREAESRARGGAARKQRGRRGRRGRPGGSHSPPHTAVRESQSSSSARTHSCRSMLLGRPRRGPGQVAGRRRSRASAGRAGRQAQLVRTGGRGARGAPGPRACRLPPPAAPSPGRAAPRSWLQRLPGWQRAPSRRLAARPRLRLPVLQAASENAPCSL